MTASSPPPAAPGPASPPPAGPWPPAGPPPGGALGSRRGWRALLPVAISAVAVFIALVSLGVAVRAVGQANDAKEAVAALDTGAGREPDSTTTTTGAPQRQTEAPPAVDTTSSEPPELNERTDYDVEYEKQNLTLIATSDSPMTLDVDEPRAQSPSQDADLSLNADYNAQRFLTLGDGVRASADGAPGMSPQDCYDRIRTAPLPEDARVPSRQGVVLCVLTSFGAAQTRGDEWRLVRMEITGVRADDAVTVELTAWNIPR